MADNNNLIKMDLNAETFMFTPTIEHAHKQIDLTLNKEMVNKMIQNDTYVFMGTQQGIDRFRRDHVPITDTVAVSEGGDYTPMIIGVVLCLCLLMIGVGAFFFFNKGSPTTTPGTPSLATPSVATPSLATPSVATPSVGGSTVSIGDW